MKNHFLTSIATIAIMAVSGLSFTSCSDDDDKSSFQPAAYESYAAKYQITDDDAQYSSVEFTESGNYILTKNENADYYNMAMAPAISIKSPKVALKNGFVGVLQRKDITRSAYSPILYGTYTIDANGTFILEGYGKVKVVKDSSGNAYSLEFIPTSGEAFTYKATVQNRDLNSDNTNRLCRTWNLTTIQYIIKVNGKQLLNIKGSDMTELIKKLQEWAEKNDDEYEPGDWEDIEYINPKQVIFTKTGTYLVTYETEDLAISTWRWADSKEDRLLYSWFNNFEDEDMYGSVDISFSNNKLVMSEYNKEEDDEEYFEENYIYYFNEAK